MCKLISNNNNGIVISFDEYELVNLRELLKMVFIGKYPYGSDPEKPYKNDYKENPLRMCNTGDWTGQIYNLLAELSLKNNPNKSMNDQLEQINERWDFVDHPIPE